MKNCFRTASITELCMLHILHKPVGSVGYTVCVFLKKSNCNQIRSSKKWEENEMNKWTNVHLKKKSTENCTNSEDCPAKVASKLKWIFWALLFSLYEDLDGQSNVRFDCPILHNPYLTLLIFFCDGEPRKQTYIP